MCIILGQPAFQLLALGITDNGCIRLGGNRRPDLLHQGDPRVSRKQVDSKGFYGRLHWRTSGTTSEGILTSSLRARHRRQALFGCTETCARPTRATLLYLLRPVAK